jgi:hypothetical protein
MKLSLLIVSFCICAYSFTQPERLEKLDIGYVEIKFADSSQTQVMLWDDFTFEYNENHSEIIVIEGGSNKKIVYKAKKIDFIRFIHENEVIELKCQKSPKGREFILITEIFKLGDYSILQSPHFSEPIFYYLAYNNEVFSLFPAMSYDCLEFFECEALNTKYGSSDNYQLNAEEMKARLTIYIENCLPVELERNKEKQENGESPVIQE